MRFPLNHLVVVAPDWLRTHPQPEWPARYEARVENYRLPKAEADLQRLAAIIGADGFALLQVVGAPETPGGATVPLGSFIPPMIWRLATV
jgi:hypothetical protein